MMPKAKSHYISLFIPMTCELKMLRNGVELKIHLRSCKPCSLTWWLRLPTFFLQKYWFLETSSSFCSSFSVSYGNHLTLAFLLLVLAMLKCLPSSVTISIPSLLCEPSNIAFLTHTCPKFISLKFLRFWTGDSGLYRPGDSGLEESPPLRAEYPAYPRRLRPFTPETPALCVLESI